MRTARNVVEFDAMGHSYVAVFSHEHCEEERNGTRVFRGGVQQPTRVVTPIRIGTLKLRHVTTCELFRSGVEASISTGRSFCSVKDIYNWRRGIRNSFVNALAELGITDNDEVVSRSKEQFNEFMRNFYSEMAKRPAREDRCRCGCHKKGDKSGEPEVI